MAHHRRRYARVKAQVPLVARQDSTAESTLTRTLSKGGLSFKTDAQWRIGLPISVSLGLDDARLQLMGRVVDLQGATCSVAFRDTGRRGLPGVTPLLERFARRLNSLERVRAKRIPILLRCPGEQVSRLSFRFKRAHLCELDTQGAFISTAMRPEVGSEAIVILRSEQRRGRIVKARVNVVRHERDGFGVSFSSAKDELLEFFGVISGPKPPEHDVKRAVNE
ncbi:MAG: PilZ domain-containing protein [Myxococcota bacterium]